MISYGYYFDKNVEREANSSNQTYIIEHNIETEKGELKINASALNLIMGSTESNLIDGIVKNIDIEHTVDYKNDYKKANVKLKTNDKKIFQDFFQTFLSTGEIPVDRKCYLNINSDIVWNIDMKIDATDSDLDFTELNVNKLDIKGAAGSLKLTLGQKYEDTKVQIDADASKVEIFVPIDSGVRVKVDGAANSTNIKDIEMQREGSYYLSKNYKKAQNKIDIEVEINAGSLKINGINK
jgi:predicted RNA-binding protein Jag